MKTHASISERSANILYLRDVENKTYRDIAAIFGISVSRVSQLYKSAVKVSNQKYHSTHPAIFISTMAYRILFAYKHELLGIGKRLDPDDPNSPQQMAAMTEKEILSIGGVGEKSIPEINAWLNNYNLSLRKADSNTLRTKCPHCGQAMPFTKQK